MCLLLDIRLPRALTRNAEVCLKAKPEEAFGRLKPKGREKNAVERAAMTRVLAEPM